MNEGLAAIRDAFETVKAARAAQDADLLEMLHEIWNYLDNRADASDDGDGYRGNDAMCLLVKVEKAMERIEREAK